MSRESFADRPPRALGRFNKYRERISDVEENGWQVTGLRAEGGYLDEVGAFPEVLFKEFPDLAAVEMRRRPCDGFSLQSEGAREFETKNSEFFPHPYQIHRREGLDQHLDQVLRIADEELGALDYLHPLSSVIQVARADSRAPFIARCWDFGGAPGALIKAAELECEGIAEPVQGTCICYEPPTLEQLDRNPNNYHFFRSVVGHEIGHYWWSTLQRRGKDQYFPWELKEISESRTGEKDALVEQVVSLFSIFVIMYRGSYTSREPFSRDHLGEAFAKLRFESRAAARREAEILDKIEKLGVLHLFPPPETHLQPTGRARDDDGPELSSDAIRVIRNAARELVAKAEPIPFASSAAVIGQRKLDAFVNFQLVAPDEGPTWVSYDRQAEHLGSRRQVTSRWREYQVRIPYNGSELLWGHRLQVARHLAHIRLHGDWFGSSNDLRRAEDIERECTPEARDLARVMALAMYAQQGELHRGKLGLGLAQLLLERDPAGLDYLVDYAKSLFQWSAADPHRPDATTRYLAEVHKVGLDEIDCTFWGEDCKRFRVSLRREEMLEAGFLGESLRPGVPFKLFEVEKGGRVELVPMPLEGPARRHDSAGFVSGAPEQGRSVTPEPAFSR